jgi:peroxiredoxin
LTDSSIDTPDWRAIPAPEDDGAGARLLGARMPSLALPSTAGGDVDLSALGGRVVLYAYPRTGRPGAANPDGWDLIPGARGCTPQSCGFRDHFAELRRLGVDAVFGLSTQDPDYQAEAAQRLHLPFPLLSDAEGRLTGALELPTFEVGGMRLLKRLTLIVDDSVVTKVFYPVFPPDRSAAEVVAWLSEPGAPPPSPC